MKFKNFIISSLVCLLFSHASWAGQNVVDDSRTLAQFKKPGVEAPFFGDAYGIVRVQLERMLTPEETSKGIPLGKKIAMEKPFLSCTGEETKISLLVTMYHEGEQVASKSSESVACGGKRTGVGSDKVVSLLNSAVKEMQGSSKYADSFLPGDQFLGKNTFSAGAYMDGSVITPLSEELRIKLGSKTLILITAVGNSAVQSSPWVILANEDMDSKYKLGGY